MTKIVVQGMNGEMSINDEKITLFNTCDDNTINSGKYGFIGT